MTDDPARIWVTNASPTIEAVVNPVIAACDEGFVPDRVHLLANPSVEAEADEALAFVERTVEAYGGDATLDAEMLDDERDFEAIVDFYRRTIGDGSGGGSGDGSDDGSGDGGGDGSGDGSGDREVAVDVTPGRKFMSALAFQAGMRFDAEHVFYLYLHSSGYYGRLYPELPATGVDLMDFTGVFS